MSENTPTGTNSDPRDIEVVIRFRYTPTAGSYGLNEIERGWVEQAAEVDRKQVENHDISVFDVLEWANEDEIDVTFTSVERPENHVHARDRMFSLTDVCRCGAQNRVDWAADDWRTAP